MLTDIALSTMHAEDLHMVAIDRPRILRSKHLVRLSYKGLVQVHGHPARARASSTGCCCPDIAKIFHRALAAEQTADPAAFTPPDAEQFVVEIENLVRNMPAA